MAVSFVCKLSSPFVLAYHLLTSPDHTQWHPWLPVLFEYRLHLAIKKRLIYRTLEQQRRCKVERSKVEIKNDEDKKRIPESSVLLTSSSSRCDPGWVR